MLSSPEESLKPEQVSFPWHALTSFQRLMLIKTLRPSALIGAIYTFVSDGLGTQYVVQDTIDLKEMFEESSARCPMIFILSPG